MTHPLVLSFSVAALATFLATTLALALGLLTAHRRVVWLDAILTAPLVLPPTVLGYALLVTLGRGSALGQAFERFSGRPLAFSFAGIVTAAVLTSLPLVLQSVRAAIEGVDVTLLQAAKTLGASPWQVTVGITLPLASRGIAAGVVLGFARALGDFGVTLMFGGSLPGETRTAALEIYDAFLSGDEATAQRLSFTLAAVGIALVAGTLMLARRPHRD
ncbi:MAG: molybdate ABC transporter permease subunit [Archangium sp.]|nr:molybdate ABC transporter permease subunit [Archangium sp.]